MASASTEETFGFYKLLFLQNLNRAVILESSLALRIELFASRLSHATFELGFSANASGYIAEVRLLAWSYNGRQSFAKVVLFFALRAFKSGFDRTFNLGAFSKIRGCLLEDRFSEAAPYQ